MTSGFREEPAVGERFQERRGELEGVPAAPDGMRFMRPRYACRTCTGLRRLLDDLPVMFYRMLSLRPSLNVVSLVALGNGPCAA